MRLRVTVALMMVICVAGSFLFTVRTIHFRNSAIESPGETDALHAFNWWYDQRAMPDGFIPHNALLNASRELQKSMPKESHRVSSSIESGSQWYSIGPSNVGGRVLSITINPQHPNIVWVGSASGGLWKSTTGGEGANPWTHVLTGFPSLAISTIAIDSTNPNVMYIGTGEISLYHRGLTGVPGARSSYGLGILKSIDGGATWDSTTLAFQFPQLTAVERIILNPKNSQTVYAATSEGTFKSTDAGATWALVDSVLMAMDIVIDPVDTTVLFVSHGNLNSSPGAGIYRTDDAGANWLQLNNGLPTTNFGRTALSISPTDHLTIYAGVSNGSSGAATGIYKTTNSGALWTQVNTTSYVSAQGWYDNVVAVDPTNASHVYISGFDIYQSTNGGSNFSDISAGYVHVDQHAITFDPTDQNTMYFGCDGGIYKSSDGGTSFLNLNNGFVTTQFYPGFSVFQGDSVTSMGGLQDNGSVKYTGSLPWIPVLGADGGWTAIDQTNKNVMYGEYQYLTLFKTTNGGATFSNVQNGLPSGSGNANFIPPFVMSYSNPSVLYAGTQNVYKTTNAGGSWFASNGQGTLNGTFISCIGVSYTNPDTVIAGTGSSPSLSPLFQIYASTNGGASWSNVTGSLPNRYPTDIEFDPTNSSVAYLTYSGWGTPHLFKTTNAGFTWTDLSSNLPDIPHQSVVVDPEYPNHLYVGTDLGVFVSTNGGVTWSDYNDGMPPAMVQDLVVSRSNNALRAATFGNGIYERKLPRVALLSLTSFDNGGVFVGGSMQNITWSEKYLNAVKLEYSTDNGTTWTSITDSVGAQSGAYSWTLPLVTTYQARLRISDAPGGQVIDTSGVFSILFNPDVVGGWNLISVEYAAPDLRRTMLFPNAISSAFAYTNSYVVKDTLQTGVGYWLKFNQPAFNTYSGDSLLCDTINIKTGWNMIGALSKTIAVSSIIDPNIISLYFGYSEQYFIADSLHPGRGYWMKSKEDGQLILCTSANMPQSTEVIHQPSLSPNVLTIRDNEGHSQSLYFSDDESEYASPKYELPPVPPMNLFDVRFSSGRMAEFFSEGKKEIGISATISSGPLSIEWNVPVNHLQHFYLNAGGTIVPLAGKGSIALHNGTSEKISLGHASNIESPIPQSYKLEQNYPNPFNPSTEVRFEIPVSSFVTLKVYDVEGREVAILVNEWKNAGAYATSWNASASASGIYFYTLSTGSFSTTKKMLLVK